MYAIIKSGGKQYRVSKGDTIRVESRQEDVGSEIEISEVLAVGEGDDLNFGKPFVEGAKVLASVSSVGREKKITIIKFQRRKDKHLKQGHRQYYTELKINDIVI